MSAKLVKIIKEDTKYSATIDAGPKFYVSHATKYQKYRGITNDAHPSAPFYDPAEFPTLGYWAKFMLPTGYVESVLALTNLNTYDSAAFTFGFLQFAAHVPNGDFVRFFRSLLARPEAADYFPDLFLQNGRIMRKLINGTTQLEDDKSTQALMDYLNPNGTVIDDIEVINGAKFIDWTKNVPEARQLQVAEALNTVRNILKHADLVIGLGGRLDTICLVIMDIMHQGRGKTSAIIQALHSSTVESKQLTALLKIGAASYPDRIAGLKKKINELVASGDLGVKRYRSATGDFG
ncbi:hypothetical protein [Prosthecobacter sp.]|uniref:hypothetical protein n=1 Tax=Prosthecobacter sp. TaxID=1965333 RepID=UPI003784D210